jgi:hypothetical protein
MLARAIDMLSSPLETSRQDYPRGGRGERIRTSDILLPKQALYQAEPRPAARIARVLAGSR